ncbi:MAG: hypothetical protein HQ581_17940, partial [Planctomycetes bacterium]|nr:hypothetical protein [Planctomycetota bacterium]
AVTGKVLGTQSARNRFTDMDISPDGRVVYAADYGGERTGHRTPIEPHYVHRLTLASSDWEVAPAPKIGLRVEALSAEMFVLQEGDQWIAISLNRWPENDVAVTELSRIMADNAGNCEYDPFRGRLFHGNSKISWSRVSPFGVGPNGFTRMENVTYAQGYARGGAVLSADGRFFFHDRHRFDTRDVKRSPKVFPNYIKGATADLAFTETEVCDIETAEVLQHWGYKTPAVGVSLAGDQVVTFDADKHELVVFKVDS